MNLMHSAMSKTEPDRDRSEVAKRLAAADDRFEAVNNPPSPCKG